MIVACGIGLADAALGVTVSGLSAVEAVAAGAGVPEGTVETGFGAAGGLGTPVGEGGTEGDPPRGFSGAKGVRGLGGTPVEGETGTGDGVERLAGAGTAGAGGFSGAGGTDPIAGVDAPAVGTGLGGSFNGGSFIGEGEPAGKSEAGGVFGDGVSLTMVRNWIRRIMYRTYSCQSCT